MTNEQCWDTFKAEGAAALDQLRSLVHAGNVRRVIVEHDGRRIAEFPLTAGVVGMAIAPPLAAIGAIVALLQDCTIRVERTSAAAAGSQSRCGTHL